ncbi:hypothetical protein [Geoanaerobacter pelophilus]|uniref:hypothetical protein n=1 Tax=Geoanaerobacter pelophilus TaxID=60036 RepID=UPI000A272246|nr:hypothetical protein [Geoanaerobacter pelophilus]
MAHRDRTNTKKTDRFDYCFLEVQLKKKGKLSEDPDQVRLVTVDNQLETILFVRNNLDACIENIALVRKTETGQKR